MFTTYVDSFCFKVFLRYFFHSKLKDMFIDFRERGREREGEKEREISM